MSAAETKTHAKPTAVGVAFYILMVACMFGLGGWAIVHFEPRPAAAKGMFIGAVLLTLLVFGALGVVLKKLGIRLHRTP